MGAQGIRQARIVTAIGVVAAAGAFLTWPGESQIKLTTCEPSGPLSALSASIHGERFWQAQLPSLDRTAAAGAEWRRKEANIVRTREGSADAANAYLQDFYKNNSKLAPSDQQRYAQILRERADKIEFEAAAAKVAAALDADAEKARRCASAIRAVR